MDLADKLQLQADTAAEGHLAVTLEDLARVLDEDEHPFDEDQIGALRETFKVGWLKGYGVGYLEAFEDMSNRLKGLVNE